MRRLMLILAASAAWVGPAIAAAVTGAFGLVVAWLSVRQQRLVRVATQRDQGERQMGERIDGFVERLERERARAEERFQQCEQREEALRARVFALEDNVASLKRTIGEQGHR